MTTTRTAVVLALLAVLRGRVTFVNKWTARFKALR